jgi:hypothetical protein
LRYFLLKHRFCPVHTCPYDFWVYLSTDPIQPPHLFFQRVNPKFIAFGILESTMASTSTQDMVSPNDVVSSTLSTSESNMSVTERNRPLPPISRATFALNALCISVILLLILEAIILVDMARHDLIVTSYGIAALVALSASSSLHLYGLFAIVGPLIYTKSRTTLSASSLWPFLFTLCTTLIASAAVAMHALLSHRIVWYWLVFVAHIPCVGLAFRAFSALKTVEVRSSRSQEVNTKVGLSNDTLVSEIV